MPSSRCDILRRMMLCRQKIRRGVSMQGDRLTRRSTIEREQQQAAFFYFKFAFYPGTGIPVYPFNILNELNKLKVDRAEIRY